MKKKIAFIVQRYGLEVNGGAEYHCRIVAEKLKEIYNVEILTSCAKDYLSWADEYEEGVEYVNGIKVLRFATNEVRDWEKFTSTDEKLRKKKPYQKVLRSLGLLSFYEKIIPGQSIEDDGAEWIRLQGPYMPGLIKHLEAHHTEYDALIFFTYLYYPTVYGIKVAPQKSILIPTAHDERQIYYPMFKSLFATPKAILYNTGSEMKFVNQTFHNQHIYSDVVGVGVEPLQPTTDRKANDILNFEGEYLIYIGRIDVAKGCNILFDHFLNYKNTTGNKIKLVLIGLSYMEIPQHPDIAVMGFVDEDVKITLLKNARALIMPSFFESLSMVTLESMVYGVPVIANEQCEVLKDHIHNSKAGFLYHDFNSFLLAVNTLLNPNTDTTVLSRHAKKYVAENYTWQTVIEKFKKAIDFVDRK